MGEPAKVRVLSEPQCAKLAEIRSVLDRRNDAEAVIGLGLIAEGDWPGTGLCVFDPAGLTETQSREPGEARRAGLRPELARSILNPLQRAKLAEFERRLQLAREAVQVGLILRPGGEPLCH